MKAPRISARAKRAAKRKKFATGGLASVLVDANGNEKTPIYSPSAPSQQVTSFVDGTTANVGSSYGQGPEQMFFKKVDNPAYATYQAGDHSPPKPGAWNNQAEYAQFMQDSQSGQGNAAAGARKGGNITRRMLSR